MATQSNFFELHGDSDTSWTVSGRGRDFNTAVVDEYANKVEPPVRITRCPSGTQSMNLAERGQERLLMLANLNLHHGRLSLLAWEDMFFAAEGQLDYHPMAGAEDAQFRSECRLSDYSGRRPDAPVWIARPSQSFHFLVADRKMTSGDDITEAGYFVRPLCRVPWLGHSVASNAQARRHAQCLRPQGRQHSACPTSPQRRPCREGWLPRHHPRRLPRCRKQSLRAVPGSPRLVRTGNRRPAFWRSRCSRAPPHVD